MHFVHDDILDDQKEEKRMKRGKKEADRAKETKEGKRRAPKVPRSTGGSNATQVGPSGYYPSKRARYEETFDPRGCYVCGETGHLAKFCQRRFSNHKKERF